MNSQVYHEGEIAVQERAGDRATAARRAVMIGATIGEREAAFLATQQMLVLAAGRPGGEVWATVWFGPRGFAVAGAAGGELWIDQRSIVPVEVDPLAALVTPGAPVGVLAIELATRRRLRINGTVIAATPASLALEVREVFPNCPKYIAQRRLRAAAPGATLDAPAARGEALDLARRATIARTDTVFVASLHPERGADASHRGGDPGFVRVVDEHTLRVPDYAGNGMYQTLGNLHATGRAGLVFLDFDGRRLLHVTGTTTLRFDDPDPSLRTGGTRRAWDLRIERWVEGPLPAAVGADLVERSPVVPRT